jgi:hypothetical protein
VDAHGDQLAALQPTSPTGFPAAAPVLAVDQEAVAALEPMRAHETGPPNRASDVVHGHLACTNGSQTAAIG